MVKRKERTKQTLKQSNDPIRSDSDHEDDDKSGGFFACYLLTSLCPRYKGHTYIGFTVNPRRRIRQHNGELCSGATRTKKKRPWEMVLCIHGFPTNTAALQFEWAWQHPVESLAVRKAAVEFKSLGGLANKIKLAYTMLTLPAWNNLNLTVNFFSTKYTKHYAGCPTLPTHMRVHIRSMDELPCYTEGYKEAEDDIFNFDNGSWDDEEPEKSGGSCNLEVPNEGVTMPVSVSKDHAYNQEVFSVSYAEIYEQPSYLNDMWDNDLEVRHEDVTMPAHVSTDCTENQEAFCVTNAGNNEQPSCLNDLWDNDLEAGHEDVTIPIVGSADQQNNKEAICVSDDEIDERPFCTKKHSPRSLFVDIPESSFTGSDYYSAVFPTMENENGKADCGRDKNEPRTTIAGSSHQVEVIDIFSPSPEYRIRSKRKKRGVSGVCPDIIDLTESPICV
ncbi:structure-specific endonuclease subunit SLX1 [Tanacetum coccineum]